VTQYRLPDELGGLPVTVTTKGIGDTELWAVVVDAGDESFPMWLPPTVLVEVLPPEPPNQSVVLLTDGVHLFDVWARNDYEGYANGKHWYLCGFQDARTWADICEAAKGRGQTLSQLIPDPADSANRESRITIPTSRADQKLHIAPPDGDGYIPVSLTTYGRPALINAEGAQAAAAVLLRNAREARAKA